MARVRALEEERKRQIFIEQLPPRMRGIDGLAHTNMYEFRNPHSSSEDNLVEALMRERMKNPSAYCSIPSRYPKDHRSLGREYSVLSKAEPDDDPLAKYNTSPNTPTWLKPFYWTRRKFIWTCCFVYLVCKKPRVFYHVIRELKHQRRERKNRPQTDEEPETASTQSIDDEETFEELDRKFKEICEAMEEVRHDKHAQYYRHWKMEDLGVYDGDATLIIDDDDTTMIESLIFGHADDGPKEDDFTYTYKLYVPYIYDSV
jgi:hypothetical protein